MHSTAYSQQTFPQHNGTKSYPLTRTLHLLVWLCFAVSSFVLFNPAPVDGLMVGLMILLPMAGMTRFSKEMYIYLAMMLIIAAGAFFGVLFAFTFDKALMHAVITLHIALFTFVISGYIAKNPHHSIPLIMSGWTLAAWIAVITGIMGYFEVFPGAQELFTLYERPKGPFKDPNVYGTFIIPPALYAIYKITHLPAHKVLLPLATLGLMVIGVLLSFSRGAWLNLGLSVMMFVYLSYATSKTNFYRVKLIGFGIIGLFLMIGLIFAALQVDKISALFTERAKVTQSYDTNDGGRFAGHAKARLIIPTNPMGIGPNQFGGNYSKEDIHNVYYNVFLNSGWLGGFAYLILVFGTVFNGFKHLFARNSTQTYFLIFYSAFIGNVIEGIIIDSDHWRHFFMLLSMIWALMAYEKWQGKRDKNEGRY